MAETTAAVRRSLAEEIQARRHLIGDDPTSEEWAAQSEGVDLKRRE